MFDRIIYEFLYWINGVSTKITSWSWCMLYSDRNKGYGNRRRQKIAKILKKVNKNKTQFGLGQVPTYGKSRSGREYGGFIKESTYNKMKYKPTNRGRNINKKGPYEI